MELGQLLWTTGINTTGLKKDSTKVSGILGKLGGGASSLLNPAALGVTAVAGAVYKLGKEAYDFSKQFNSAMLEVKTISQSAQEDFSGFSESIVNMSLQGINDDAIGLSKAMYQVVSAGYDGAEGLAVLDAAAKAATGGVTDTITAADGLTTVLNAWGMKASEVTSVSDDFFTTVRLGKTTMGELGANIAKVAPLAAATGISFKEVAAATATMTGQGTSTAEVMTQMKASIIALNKNLGDGWAETMTLNEGLQELRKMAGGSDVELQKLTGSSEAALAVLSLTGDNAQKAGEQFAEYSSNVGEAQKALNVMQEDADIMWKQVGNQFKAAMVDMGDGLLEASKGLASFLSASMTTTDQLGDNYEAIGDKVDSFSERMKVLRNEGSNFWGALGGAALSSNERIQKVVDREKKEIEDLNSEIKSIQDEYKKLQDSGASDEELNKFKQGLSAKFVAQKDATEQEYEVAKKHAKRMKVLSLASSGGIIDHAAKANKAAKNKKDDLDAYKKRVKAVEALGTDPEAQAAAERAAKVAAELAAKQAHAAAIEAAKGTIQKIEEELARLKGRRGKATSVGAEAQNEIQIRNTQKQLDNEWLKVRDAQFGKIEKMTKMKSKSVLVSKGELEVISDTLVEIKKIEKIDGTLATKAEIRAEALEKIGSVMFDTSDIMGATANLAGKLDENLGNSLGVMSDMVGQAGNLAMSLSTGDYVGAITNAIGMVSTIIDAQQQADEKRVEMQLKINDILKDRIALMIDSGMITELEGANNELEKIKENSRLIKEQIDKFKIDFRTTDIFGTDIGRQRNFTDIMDNIYGKDWDVAELTLVTSSEDNFKDFISKAEEITGFEFAGIDLEGFQSKVNEYLDSLNQIEDQYDSITQAGLGFTSQDISTQIVDGIVDGMQTAKGSIGDFSDSFRDLLKKSVIQALSASISADQLANLTTSIENAMVGGLTSDELADLEAQYASLAQEVERKAEIYSSIIGNEAETANQTGIKGAISNIQESTAGLIEAQFNALRINTLDIVGIMGVHTAHLSNIATNTAETATLLARTNQILSEIDSKTASSGSYV